MDQGSPRSGLDLVEIRDMTVVSWCLNMVSNFLMQLEKVLMEMMPPEMAFCQKVVAQVRVDPVVI